MPRRLALGTLFAGALVAVTAPAADAQRAAPARPAAATSPAAARAQAAIADLVVVNARIYTVDDTRPLVEALAVRNGRVLYAGTRRGAMATSGRATKVIDLGGRTVIPGMTDAHAHLLGLGAALRTVDLTGTTSYDEVIRRVAARAAEVPAGTWIIGRGWDQNDWGAGNTAFPTHEQLTAAVPDHPAWLERVDGHASLANMRAMQAAKVTAAVVDPTGGQVIRAADGRTPTGVFVDNAAGIVERAVPAPTAAEWRARTLAAVKEANRWGLTGIHDAGVNRTSIAMYEQLAREGLFTLRDYVMISDDSSDLAHFFARGPRSALHDGHLWVRAVKLYSDGALGSRGAALLAPYSDDPTNSGLLVSAPAHIEAVTRQALKAGFQVNTHAIGDRGNRLVLDAYERALADSRVPDARLRVEHAQILHADDIPRFAALGVIPSMQSSHQTSDMYWAGTRLGEARLQGAYAWQSLLATGVVVPNGSDFPVEQVNPLISFHAAVARQDAKNWPAGGWYPAQRMTREQALRSMTIWPAYAAFQETMLGSLTPGKYADFVVLDQDIMMVPAENILATRVLSTWLGGKAVYEQR